MEKQKMCFVIIFFLFINIFLSAEIKVEHDIYKNINIVYKGKKYTNIFKASHYIFTKNVLLAIDAYKNIHIFFYGKIYLDIHKAHKVTSDFGEIHGKCILFKENGHFTHFFWQGDVFLRMFKVKNKGIRYKNDMVAFLRIDEKVHYFSVDAFYSTKQKLKEFKLLKEGIAGLDKNGKLYVFYHNVGHCLGKVKKYCAMKERVVYEKNGAMYYYNYKKKKEKLLFSVKYGLILDRKNCIVVPRFTNQKILYLKNFDNGETLILKYDEINIKKDFLDIRIKDKKKEYIFKKCGESI